MIVEIKQAKNRSKLSALEKLKGHECAYKIRLSDYWMGIFLENDTVIFSRFLHRKEIYKKVSINIREEDIKSNINITENLFRYTSSRSANVSIF